jgi:hypothetical protein
VGVKKVQDGRTQVLTTKESSKEGKPLEEGEQIKYPNPFQSQETYQISPNPENSWEMNQ